MFQTTEIFVDRLVELPYSTLLTLVVFSGARSQIPYLTVTVAASSHDLGGSLCFGGCEAGLAGLGCAPQG